MARRALLLIDGLDEGGKERERITEHITQVLAPQGHVMLVTSRPAGINEAVFKGFARLDLKPLSDAQQQLVVVQRLGHDHAAELIPYLLKMVPTDPASKQRITANPLMLSMIISISELRRGVGMPNSVVSGSSNEDDDVSWMQFRGRYFPKRLLVALLV